MWRIKRDGIENMVENVLKNTVRNAQVKVQLYKCYMSDTQNKINVEKLCPTFMSEQKTMQVRNSGKA